MRKGIKKVEHPEHATCWERNEYRFLITLGVLAVFLLILPVVAFDLLTYNTWTPIIYMITLLIDLFLFSSCIRKVAG